MTSPSRSSDLRDDLLADLRQVAPPAAPSPPRSEPERPADEAPTASSVDVRIAWQRWSRVRLRASASGSGVVLTGGPLRLQLGFTRP